MLPLRLVDVELEGERLRPRWLSRRHRHWVEALQDRLEALVGRPRREVEERLARLRVPEAPPRARRAVQHVLLSRHGFDVRRGPRPAEVRRVAFELAARRARLDRARVLEEAAARLGVAVPEVEAQLLADRRAERLLRPASRSVGSDELVEIVNLEMLAALLRRARRVRCRLESRAVPVLRRARSLGLMVEARSAPHAGARLELELSGPLSLFRRTTRYGNALARWLPALVAAPRWGLAARCRWRGRDVLVTASHRDPLATTHPPPPRFDSAVEERLFRDLERLETPWRVLREARVVRAGTRLAVPDFALVDESSRRSVPVEVVGYWTREYLEKKLDLLAALPPGETWVVAVDEALGVEGDARLADLPVLGFRRRVDARQLLERVERVASRELRPDV